MEIEKASLSLLSSSHWGCGLSWLTWIRPANNQGFVRLSSCSYASPLARRTVIGLALNRKRARQRKRLGQDEDNFRYRKGGSAEYRSETLFKFDGTTFSRTLPPQVVPEDTPKPIQQTQGYSSLYHSQSRLDSFSNLPIRSNHGQYNCPTTHVNSCNTQGSTAYD